VTVMFCDMKGFTALSEKLDVEEVYSILGEVHDVLIREVYQYGGTVNDISGDGLMALFGAPVAVEDGPQRSIRSAAAIHRSMVKLSERMQRENPSLPTIKMRIGIHTGPVVVGDLGNDLRIEFTAIGDTVNLAARMEGLAEPGTTYVTEKTFRLTEGFFRFEALGELKVRGREEPVRAYRVIAASTGRTRFDVSAEWGLTPFVGRGRELEVLVEAVDRAKAGRGQAISVIAEAGMGKSRLLYEFRKAVANEDLAFFEGRCLSYGEGIAYHPVIEILRSNFDIQESDRVPEIKEKLGKGLKELGDDVDSTLPCLLEFLSATDGRGDEIMMNPEARKDRIIDALKRIVLKGSEIRPLIIAIEDLHRIDKSSEDALKDILNNIAGARIFLIFTYRPEFVHTWGGRSYHSQLNLNRLSNRETLAMVTHLLGTEDFDRSFEEFLLEKTEGIPFFIEEFVKSLKDLNIIDKRGTKYVLAKDIRDMTIPGTLQDIILARVDCLPEGAKEVLQTGSVIAREFSYELIRKVTHLPEEELLSHLSALKDAELIYERGIFPRSTYIFKHALTCEVVYNSILAERKKELHERIADAIEDTYRNTLEEYFEILAEHYVRSENHEKGAEYSGLASKKAEKAGSLKDAVAYGRKAIACLERLPPHRDVQKKILDIKTKIGLYFAEMIHFDHAMREVESVADLAKAIDYNRPLPKIYTISGAYNFFVKEDFPPAIEDLERSITISERLKDIPSLVLANTYLGVARAFCCDYKKSLESFEKSLEISIQFNSLWGISIEKSNISLFGYNWQGKLDMGYRTSEEAIHFADRSGDIYSRSVAYSCHGWSCYYKGFLQEAERYLRNACSYFEKIDIFSFWALAKLCLGLVHFETGHYLDSINCHKESISLFKNANIFPSFANFNEIAILRAKLFDRGGEFDLTALSEYEKRNRLKIYEGWIPGVIGEILLHRGDDFLPRGRDWILKAIEADKKNGMRWNLGRDYLLDARFLKRQGERTESKNRLAEALALFEESGAEGDLKRARAELLAE